jgi:hypothetical protein
MNSEIDPPLCDTVVSHVPSKENIADVASRPDKHFSEEERHALLRASIRRFQRALREWWRWPVWFFSRFSAGEVEDVSLEAAVESEPSEWWLDQIGRGDL